MGPMAYLAPDRFPDFGFEGPGLTAAYDLSQAAECRPVGKLVPSGAVPLTPQPHMRQAVQDLLTKSRTTWLHCNEVVELLSCARSEGLPFSPTAADMPPGLVASIVFAAGPLGTPRRTGCPCCPCPTAGATRSSVALPSFEHFLHILPGCVCIDPAGSQRSPSAPPLVGDELDRLNRHTNRRPSAEPLLTSLQVGRCSCLTVWTSNSSAMMDTIGGGRASARPCERLTRS